MDANQLVDIEWHAAELKAGLIVLNREDCIICPRVSMELSIRLILAERKADTPGVEEEQIAIAADLLRVGVSAREDFV